MELVTWIRLQWDRALAVTLAVISGLMLIIGWFRVSDSPVVTDQMAYVVSAGLGGLFLFGVAATLWLSADFRDEWRAIQYPAERPVARDDDDDGPEGDRQRELEARLEALEARLDAIRSTGRRNRTASLEAAGRSDNGEQIVGRSPRT